MFFVKCYITKIDLFWIKPFSKRFDVSINLLSEERSFTKKGLFLLRKNNVPIFGEVLHHQNRLVLD
jgi:hypothetical protein